MDSIQSFVDNKLREQLPDGPAVPISFRGSEITAIQADILAGLLGYSTRSKFLADLLPAALNHAIESLPQGLISKYNKELTKALEGKYRSKGGREKQ